MAIAVSHEDMVVEHGDGIRGAQSRRSLGEYTQLVGGHGSLGEMRDRRLMPAVAKTASAKASVVSFFIFFPFFEAKKALSD